ncbi:hypothetical protein HanIR_Chr16g0788661 [Helianthus annuus]|nr:hypothetical protein HanIR_Chr16g0788661 [Helianthus annuus]
MYIISSNYYLTLPTKKLQSRKTYTILSQTCQLFKTKTTRICKTTLTVPHHIIKFCFKLQQYQVQNHNIHTNFLFT